MNDLKLLRDEKPMLNELNVLIKDITVLKSISWVPSILFIMYSFLNEINHKRNRISSMTAEEIIKDKPISYGNE
tara:strand:- start:51 stop:272 length:222 start_codon:yes stop_codon:yes gene_type:complete